MKSSFLALSFLFLAFSTKSLLARTDPEPLVDINGNELLVGTDYYIVSSIWGAGGGGLRLHAGRNGTCPLDVIQARSDLDWGLPLTFLPADNKDGVIYQSAEVNIKFTTVPPYLSCNQPTVWKVDEYDQATGLQYITTNGVEGNPSITSESRFRFQRFGQNSYAIVHCSARCEDCVIVCGHVGISVTDDGVRRLALSNRPFTLVFMKASWDASANHHNHLLIKQKMKV